MKEDAVILLAEDDDGHAALTQMALREVGVKNQIIRLRDGQETLDFLFGTGQGPSRDAEIHYLLLLDLRMPKIDGIAVFRTIRQDEQLRQMPVVVLSTTDNQQEIETCRQLHCSRYIVKAAGYKALAEALQHVKLLLEHRQAPRTMGQN